MCCPQFSLNLEVELDNDPGTFGGSTTNRKCTDVLGLIIMVLIFGTVIGLSAYCISNSEVEKLINGYDNYGNICGKNNNKIDSISLDGFGKNMEQKKYVLIKEDAVFGTTRECAENCTMQSIYLVNNYCVSDEKFIPIQIEMLEFWKFILLYWFIGFFFHVFEVLFVNSVKKFKWIFIFSCLLFLLVMLVIIWYWISYIFYSRMYNYCKIFLPLGIFVTFSIVAHVSTICSKQFRSKEDLSIQLFIEGQEIIYSIPYFLLFIVLFSIIISGFIVAMIYTWVWTQSFSYPRQINAENESRIIYVQYPIATVTGVLVIYAACLLYEFARNCQCMIIAGFVAQRYFTRSHGVDSDLFNRSIANLLKYHLGTVCCGSVLLPFVYALRALVNGVTGAASGYNSETVCTCSCRLLSVTCLAPVKTFLDYFSQNAFIMTAMNGGSFCAGTIRAHKLISHNSFNLPSIMTFQHYVLEYLKLISILGSIICSLTFIRYGDNAWFTPIALIIHAVLFYAILDVSISAYKVAIDTIFLCFSEDVLYNNGTTKPYFATANFAQFIENANLHVNSVKWQQIADKWDKGPRRLYS